MFWSSAFGQNFLYLKEFVLIRWWIRLFPVCTLAQLIQFLAIADQMYLTQLA